MNKHAKKPGIFEDDYAETYPIRYQDFVWSYDN